MLNATVIDIFIKNPFVFKVFIPLKVFFNSLAFFFSVDVRTTAPTSLSDNPINTLYTLHAIVYHADLFNDESEEEMNNHRIH